MKYGATRINKILNLLPKDGELYLYPKVFSHKESLTLFSSLQNSINWKQERIKIFGKWVTQPRLSAWYADAGVQYHYSGITLQPEPWTKQLSSIKEKVQSLHGTKFNSALLNLYRNGEDSMGWHRDNERELGDQPVIGSVSFGCERIFQLQHTKQKNLKLSLNLSSGSYALMLGDTQRYWRHSIPKQKNINTPRINITFRYVYQ